MSICLLCQQEKKLIKAHLLPKSILDRISDNKGRHVSAELQNLRNHSFKQDGYWDKNILCKDCDNSFSQIEQYFLSFIKDKVNDPFKKIKTNDGEFWHYNNVDGIKLRLFPLITLWRMAISKSESCRNVDLGPLESLVYNCIKSLNPGPYDFFPFVIYSLKEINDGRATFIGDPLPLKIDGHKYYLLPISDFVIFIRAGKNVNEGLVKSSVYENSIQIVNLKGRNGVAFLDALYSNMKAIPR